MGCARLPTLFPLWCGPVFVATAALLEICRLGGRMSQEVKVPDIGNYANVPVIEILVAPGDTVKKDQGLLTLESDKATMEVPAPFAGVVKRDSRQGRR